MAGFVLFVVAFVTVVSMAWSGGGLEESLLIAGVALAATSAVATWSYFGGSSAILQMSMAKAVQKADDPELFNVVEEMAIAAGIPVPQIYLIQDTALNAFATGRDPEHAAVAITSGLREELTRDELQAVIAHEISHVRYYDIRLTMLLTTLVGLVVLFADFFMRSMRWRFFFGGGPGRRSDRRDGGINHPAIMIIAIALAVVAPIFARLIQLAASRQREYLADAGSVELTRNPGAMTAALAKLAEDREVLEVANRATAHLYIVPPIKEWEERAQGMFATHPPVEERIQRLQLLLPA